MTTPDQFTASLRATIAADGKTVYPFTGQPAAGIPSPIEYRLFNSDFDLCQHYIIKDDAGIEHYIFSVQWHGPFALVGLIPVPAPAEEPAA